MSRNLKYINGDTHKVGTLFCVASNYSQHAEEMGTYVPSEPAIFIKPPQSVINSGESIKLPECSDNVHHEVELVVSIAKDCCNVSKDDAKDYIAGYAVGIDVTMRDVQSEAKKAGKPWAVAKGFVTSAPLSDFIPANNFETIPEFELQLEVNGELRQKAFTSTMERDIPTLIEFLSKVFTLRSGDLIFTGTPAGVGRINKGDSIKAELIGFVSLNVNIE